MDRKQRIIKYGSLVHFSCEEGYIAASGLEAEDLFIREKNDTDIDEEPLPLLGFETSVFRIEAPASSLAAKAQEAVADRFSNNNTLLMEHFSNINTAPELMYGKPFLLLHSVSQMCVAVFPSKPSKSDPNCVRLVLVKAGEVESDFCEFVVTPRYKIHDDGDPVCRGDEVLLRLAAFPIFVHVTGRKHPGLNTWGMPSEEDGCDSSINAFEKGLAAGRMVDDLRSEVNGSEERAVGFVVQRYDIGRDQANYQRALYHIARPYVPSGVPVLLYHRERESFLTTSLTSQPRQQKESEENKKTMEANVVSGGDNGISGGALLTNKESSFVEGVFVSRSATQLEGSGISTLDTPDANDNTDGDVDHTGTPFPLLMKDETSTGCVSNEGTALNDFWRSCTALWILENENPTIGGAVRMRSVKYRLRQACSNMYLAVAGSGVDAFFEGNGESDFSETVDGMGAAALEEGGDAGSNSSRNQLRAASLCMIPPPRTAKDSQRTLFTLTPMFFTECNFLIENDCLTLQNVLTGMYVCTQEARDRLFLQWQPSVSDTITVRSSRQEIVQDVMFLRSHCERLCRYRDAFQALARLKNSRHPSFHRDGGGLEPYPGKHESSDSCEENLTPTRAAFVQGGALSTDFAVSSLGRQTRTTETPYAAILPVIYASQSSLEELIRFCSLARVHDALRLDGIPIVRRQRMIFELNIHRLVMDVILTPFSLLQSEETDGMGDKTMSGMLPWGCSPRLPPLPLMGGFFCMGVALDDAHSEVHLVCRLAFRFLRQMVRKAKMLKKWLVEFIPYFLELGGYRFRVSDTMTELFSENNSVPRPVVESVADHFIGSLRRGRSAGHLNLLSSMCTVGFSGIFERQAMVCQKLLVENSELLSRFVLNQNGEWAVVVNEGEAPVECGALFELTRPQNSQQQLGSDAKYARFLQSEIQLLGCLCFDGCPSMCCAEVGRVFPPEVLLRAIQTFVWTGAEVMGSPSPLDLLRGHILRLAVQCYIMPRIDDPAVQLRASTVLFGSSSLRLREETHLPISGKPDDDLISSVKAAALNIIRANPHFVQSDMSRSVLLRVSINAWLRLVKAHQISVQEMCDLIPPLLGLLDGTKDIVDDNASRVAAHTLTRLEVSEASVQVMETREMICNTLLQLLETVSNRVADNIILLLYDAFVKGGSFPRRKMFVLLDFDEEPVLDAKYDLHVWPSEGQALLCEKGTGLLHRVRGKYQSVDITDEAQEMDSNRIDSKEVVELLGRVCKSIMLRFRVKELVPLLMDLTRYESQQLTARATELLIRLCVVKRTVAHRVLQVHTLPSSEVVRSFDHLYTVAVNTLTLERRGCFDEAIAFALSNIEEPEGTHDDSVPSEELEEEYLIEDDGSDDEAGGDDGGAGADQAGKEAHGGRHLWGKTAGAVRVLAYHNAVRRRRRSVGLSENSELPLRLIVRMELVCHWGIHIPLMRMHASIDPNSRAFFQWMRFFYLFTFVRGNARKLLGSIDLFMRSLNLKKECTVMCLHIIVAIFASVADPTPYLSNTFLTECVKYLDSEVSTRHADVDFLSRLSNYVFSNPAVGGVPRRRMMQLLRDYNILRCLPRPGGVQVSPVRCDFIASMVELLCHICNCPTSALAMGQRALPMQDIFAIILEYGSLYSPLHRKSYHQRDELERKQFQLVGTYLRALVLLYITAEREEGGQGKEMIKLEWMANREWWAVVEMLTRQLHGITELILTNKGKVVNRGIRVIQRYRHVWLMSLPVALLTFFSACFSEAGFYRYQDSVGVTFAVMCSSLMEFSSNLISNSDALELSVQEAVNYRRLLGLLHMQTANIVGLETLSSQLEIVRDQILHWLLQRERLSKAERQGQGGGWEERARSSDFDEYSSPHDTLAIGEGVSQRIQDSLGDSFSARLFLSSGVSRCRELEATRSALRTFVKSDVLIPIEDSLEIGEAANVVNALLCRSSALSGVRGFVWSALDGMRKRYFSPMALVGLLNLFYNALYASFYVKESPPLQAAEGAGKNSTEREDTWNLLQLTFTDLGMSNVVASLSVKDDDVITYSSIRLSVMLLEGGNTRAQYALLKDFGAHQVRFFHNIRELLQKSLQWVRQINLQQQLVILECGGTPVGSNSTLFTSALFAAVLKSSSYRKKSERNGGKEKHILGWDRVEGCMRLRLLHALFRMLQLFCEGHNLGMQNYIRFQHDNMHSVNIVHEVLLLLAELSGMTHGATVDVIRGGFELLTELCQGPCHENQTALLSYDVCVTMCGLLDVLSKLEIIGTRTAPENNSRNMNTEMGITNTTNTNGTRLTESFMNGVVSQRGLKLTRKAVDCLRVSLTTFLLSLIEGCRSPETFRRVLAQIPIEIIEHQLSIATPEMCDRILEDETLEDDPTVAALFNWLIFLHIVRPFADGLYLQHIDELLRRTTRLRERLGRIEIRRDDGLLEKVFFCIPSICRGLSQNIKDDVLWSVNRTSRATKLGDFLHQSDNLIFEVERAHDFQRWVARWTRFTLTITDTAVEKENEMDTEGVMEEKKVRFYSLKKCWNRFMAPFIFSSQLSYYEYASILFAVLINIGLISVEGAKWDWATVQVSKLAITCLCVLQFVLSCVTLCMDAVVFFPACLYKEYRRKEHMRLGIAKLNATMREVFDGLTKGEVVYHFLTRFTIQFRLFLVVTAALSLLVSRYFAAAHLLFVIYKVPTLCTFINAITQNGKQLLLTAFLGVVVLYLFAIVGYLLFPRQFDSSDGPENGNCVNLFRCFLFILWQGLRQGGGVGDIMQEESWSSSTLFPRVSYDLVFFALVNVVFLNIMFGLIIDTFGELRDAKREKELDMKSTCFVCGLEADEFERAHVGGFRAHVVHEHNMWMYFYFMHYLRRKDPNDFTGQESYVDERIRRGDLGFFPEEDSLSLGNGGREEDAAAGAQKDVSGMDEEGCATRPGREKAPAAGSGAANGQEVALTLKELAGVKEALSAFVRDVSADAQKVKSLLQQLEIMSRGAHVMSLGGGTANDPGSTSGTRLSRGEGSKSSLRRSIGEGSKN
ncbi:putative inositol 1,4,5-trisphosphate receptor [Trypanosoma cruzi]|uniref:Putative inositol 1,4,5-trisphosphate receptor n=1 Tax=Trypanosoma cruzi TaxID=5693 RepID=A0A2V2X7I0_TRYCR|nr:putative inositol 1,4,5-trisphosphate receptor [Trypanosoma cruzi]